MATVCEGQRTQKPSLVDAKKQQWAKERDEIARLDEMFSSSTHHHHEKIERTSVRTYYSNLDLEAPSKHLNPRPQQNPTTNISQHTLKKNYSKGIIPKYSISKQYNMPGPRNTNYGYTRIDLTNGHNEVNRNDNNDVIIHNDVDDNDDDYDYDEEIMYDGGNEGEFEDDTPSRHHPSRNWIRLKRGQYTLQTLPVKGNLLQQRYNTTSMMDHYPGNRKYRYIEQSCMPSEQVMQTARPRIQNAYILKQTQTPRQQHPQNQYLRSPSLPVIRQRDYMRYKRKVTPKNQQHKLQQQQQQRWLQQQQLQQPQQQQQLQPQKTTALVLLNPSNQIHRLNNNHNNNNSNCQIPNVNNVGCQEEDTSGYISDSPKFTHTPNIWFNDGASQIESILSGGGGTTSSIVGSSTDMNPYNSKLMKNQVEQQQQHQQQQPPALDRTFIVDNKRLGIASTYQNVRGRDFKITSNEPIHKGGFYIISDGNPYIGENSDTPVSMSSTKPFHGTAKPNEMDTYQQQLNEDRERVTFSHAELLDKQRQNQQNQPNQLQQSMGPGWLNRGHHDLKDSEDDNQSLQSSIYLRGQNVKIDEETKIERVMKKRKALEYHEAIKEQLKEKEMQRKCERERHKQEERLIEERVRKQKELEDERLEMERQQLQVKKEKEQQKQQAVVEAIAKAEEAAKLERQKKKQKYIDKDKDQIDVEIHAEREVKEKLIMKTNEDTKGIVKVNEKVKQKIELDEKILIGTPINLRKTFIKSLPTEGIQNKKTEQTKPGDSVMIMQPATIIPLPVTTDIFHLQNAIGNLQIATYLTQPKTENGTAMGKVNGNSEETEMIETKEIAENPESFIVLQNSEGPATITKSNILEDSTISQDVETQTELPLNCDLCLFHDNFYKVLLKREVSTTTTTQKTKGKPAKEMEKDHEMTTTTTTTTTTTFKAKSKDKKRNNTMDERPKWGVNRPIVQYVKASDRDPFYMRNKYKKQQQQQQQNQQHHTAHVMTKAMRSQSMDSRLDGNKIQTNNIIRNIEHEQQLEAEVEIEDDKDVVDEEGEGNEQEEEEGFLLKARNVCTEILPIKTDERGRIFLNFREASAIMNEDEIKDKLRQKYFNIGRILSRRNWASATSKEHHHELHQLHQHHHQQQHQHHNGAINYALDQVGGIHDD